jgi:hypothetical protein
MLVATVALPLSASSLAQEPAKQSSDDEIQKQVLAADNARYDAMGKRDMAALDRLHTDGLVFTNTKGKLLNKTEYLEEVRSGNLKFKTVDIDQYEYHIYGDTVIMTGRANSAVEYHGTVNTRPRRFTSTFIRIRGEWRLAAHQATIIAEPS